MYYDVYICVVVGQMLLISVSHVIINFISLVAIIIWTLNIAQNCINLPLEILNIQQVEDFATQSFESANYELHKIATFQNGVFHFMVWPRTYDIATSSLETLSPLLWFAITSTQRSAITFEMDVFMISLQWKLRLTASY
jgi:hypothetical protein